MAASVSAIVLAGGRSRRFGSDKLLADVGGRPLLHRAIEAAAEVADEVIVAAGADGPLPRLPPIAVPIHVVRDPFLDRGPRAGLEVAAAAARHPLLLVVGGDMPALVPDVLRMLVEALEAGHEAATLIGDDPAARPQPLPCAIRTDRVVGPGRDRPPRPDADRAPARGRSLSGLLDGLDCTRLAPSVWRARDEAGRTLRDVDRPVDLERFQEELRDEGS